MHALGKWFIVLALLLSAGAIWLEAKTLNIRHHWLTSVDSRHEKIEKQLADIKSLRERVVGLQQKNQTLVHSWGDVWNAPNSRSAPGGEGILEIGVGASSNLPHQTAQGVPPAVYVFGQNGNQAQYLGEFSVREVRPTQAMLNLNRRTFANETAAWPQGLYHIRGNLPANWLAVTADLEAQEIIAESRIQEQQEHLQTQNKLLADSKSVLAKRMAELNGNENAQADSSDDVKDGLVITLQKSEEQRDRLLAEVSALREQVTLAYDKMIKTISANESLVDQLGTRYTQKPFADSPATTVNLLKETQPQAAVR